METPNLLLMDKRAEIIRAIERGAAFGGDVWQNGLVGRSIHQITQTIVDTQFEKIILKTNGISHLDPNLPLYIRLAYRNIIFCLYPHEYRMNGDKITCCYPAEARGLEERKKERYVLPIDSDISISLKKVERSMRETVFDLEVRIVDVSERGFGIMISSANRDYLRKFDHFWIKAIDQRPLYNHIFGTVCYVAPKGYYLKRGDVRLGLALEDSISRDIFEYLKRKSHLILSA